jgi:hypothetical protein
VARWYWACGEEERMHVYKVKLDEDEDACKWFLEINP